MERNDYPDIFVVMPENDDETAGFYFNDENMNTHGPFYSFDEAVQVFKIFTGDSNV